MGAPGIVQGCHPRFWRTGSIFAGNRLIQHFHLQLDFCSFACKIIVSVRVIRLKRVSRCSTIVPSISGFESTSAATRNLFPPGVAFSKKILEFGLGGLKRLSPFVRRSVCAAQQGIEEEVE
jgi:hypothetical protein